MANRVAIRRDRLSTSREREFVGRGILEIPIRVIFDNDDVILPTQRIDLLAAL
jgi:hypothetical protein